MKIALKLKAALDEREVRGERGRAVDTVLAKGNGWSVADIVCTSGPDDRPFEERHSQISVAVVAAGSFEYRSGNHRELMTSGSILLGNEGHAFECRHDHGAGDRCVAFRFNRDYFEQIVSDVAPEGYNQRFSSPKLLPLSGVSALVARACAGVEGGFSNEAWEETAVRIATGVVSIGGRAKPRRSHNSPAVVRRITDVVRLIEEEPNAELSLGVLAERAGVSPYYFLRSFERLTGLTPHKYVQRARLRLAAVRLSAEPSKIIDIAFESGFGDLSNFNHAFRAEFGESPRSFRRRNDCAGR